MKRRSFIIKSGGTLALLSLPIPRDILEKLTVNSDDTILDILFYCLENEFEIRLGPEYDPDHRSDEEIWEWAQEHIYEETLLDYDLVNPDNPSVFDLGIDNVRQMFLDWHMDGNSTGRDYPNQRAFHFFFDMYDILPKISDPNKVKSEGLVYLVDGSHPGSSYRGAFVRTKKDAESLIHYLEAIGYKINYEFE